MSLSYTYSALINHETPVRGEFFSHHFDVRTLLRCRGMRPGQQDRQVEPLAHALSNPAGKTDRD
jgi:hypothetical protein